MKRLLCFIFILFASFSFAQTQNYKVSPELSSLAFDVSAQMHSVHGVTKDFSGTISGDPKDITSAKITIRLDPTHIDTQNEKRDKVMREKSLEIEKFPFIEFESTSVEAASKSLQLNQPADATIKGVLKLHGVEKEITVPVRILWDDRQLATDGTLNLKLDDYSIFRPKVLFFRLQNDVKIRFRIAAERQVEP
jgi:polyisoprenoid-binding protein YceI